jgi:hypothetical protein
MTSTKMEAMKAELAREILNEQDENVLISLLSFIRSAHRKRAALPSTSEEIREAALCGTADIRAGRSYTIDEVRSKLHSKS